MNTEVVAGDHLLLMLAPTTCCWARHKTCHDILIATTANAIIAEVRITPTALIPRLIFRQYSWLKKIRSCLKVQFNDASTSIRKSSRSPLTIGALHAGRGPGNGKRAATIQQKGRMKPRQNKTSCLFLRYSTGDKGYFERSRCGYDHRLRASSGSARIGSVSLLDGESRAEAIRRKLPKRPSGLGANPGAGFSSSSGNETSSLE